MFLIRLVERAKKHKLFTKNENKIISYQSDLQFVYVKCGESKKTEIIPRNGPDFGKNLNRIYHGTRGRRTHAGISIGASPPENVATTRDKHSACHSHHALPSSSGERYERSDLEPTRRHTSRVQKMFNRSTLINRLNKKNVGVREIIDVYRLATVA